MPTYRLLTSFFLALLFLGFWWVRLGQEEVFRLKDGQRIRVRAVLTEEPVVSGQSQEFRLAGVKIKARRFPEYHYGDFLEVVGQVKVLGRQSFLFYPEVSLEDVEKGVFPASPAGGLRGSLLAFRSRIETAVAQSLPEPQASLLLGILLGVKRQLPDDFFQQLKSTGTLHVVVASGYNVSVVAGFLMIFLASWLGRKLGLLAAFIGVALYTLMAGAEPPIVRAAIMGSVAFTAQVLGRQYDAVRALIAAAGLMLLYQPSILWDLGFQLSFAATAGIIFIYPCFSAFKRLPLLGDDLAVTVSAQLASLPILSLNFGQFVPLSPLINALVLWTVPLTMGFGALVAAAGLVVPGAGQLVAYLVWPLLTWFVSIVGIFGNWPFLNLEITANEVWWGIGYYLLLAGIIIYWQRMGRSEKEKLASGHNV